MFWTYFDGYVGAKDKSDRRHTYDVGSCVITVISFISVPRKPREDIINIWSVLIAARSWYGYRRGRSIRSVGSNRRRGSPHRRGS